MAARAMLKHAGLVTAATLLLGASAAASDLDSALAQACEGALREASAQLDSILMKSGDDALALYNRSRLAELFAEYPSATQLLGKAATKATGIVVVPACEPNGPAVPLTELIVRARSERSALLLAKRTNNISSPVKEPESPSSLAPKVGTKRSEELKKSAKATPIAPTKPALATLPVSASPARPSPPSEASADGAPHEVQIGAYRDRENARAAAKLAADVLGPDATVRSIQPDAVQGLIRVVASVRSVAVACPRLAQAKLGCSPQSTSASRAKSR